VNSVSGYGHGNRATPSIVAEKRINIGGGGGGGGGGGEINGLHGVGNGSAEGRRP